MAASSPAWNPASQSSLSSDESTDPAATAGLSPPFDYQESIKWDVDVALRIFCEVY